MKTTIKIAVIAMMNMSIGMRAQTTEYPIKQETQKINNSPWYGLGQSNVTFPSTTYSAMQLAGYYGILLKTGIGNFAFDYHGNLGIGTINPSEKLELYDSTTSPSIISLKSIRNDAQWVDVGRLVAKQGTKEVARIGMPRGTETYTGFLTFWTKETNDDELVESMRIHANGNVGIGTTKPTAKLAVNGKIHTKEVRVDLNLSDWADFVFEKEYNLPTLKEVENHIKEKGHLKDIPSAKEVEQNGIYLGEMDSKLLQKIEELTLYTIAQEKDIKELKKAKSEIAKQQKEINAQKKEIEKLKKQNSRIKDLEILVQKLLNTKN